jgi:hypothetical protein
LSIVNLWLTHDRLDSAPRRPRGPDRGRRGDVTHPILWDERDQGHLPLRLTVGDGIL